MDDIFKAIEAAIVKMPLIKYKLNEPMKNHTSIKIGAPVRAMYFPRSVRELVDLISLLRDHGIAPLVFGNGTNLLVDDRKPLEIVAIKTTMLDGAELVGEDEITAGAGIALAKLAVFAQSSGLTGFEFAHGIPGTLGGAVLMNAGAYGMEMRDVVHRSSAFSDEKGVYVTTGDNHDFSYRHSRFSEVGDIVLSASIRLRKGEKSDIGAKMGEFSSRRRESQPLEQPSAGSVFKRPAIGYAAELIEQAGLKGFSIGGAQVSAKHAGFIVNNVGAVFSDVIAVIEHVKATVFKHFGIELEQEVVIIKGY